MLNQSRKVLRNAVLGAVVAVGASGAAQATLVVGVFDPDFGGVLTGTNFSGTAQFEISQSCLDLNGTFFVFASNICGNSGFSQEKFDKAHVIFSGTENGTVDFGMNSLLVIGMYVQNHHVIGVQTTLSSPGTSMGLGGQKFEIIFGMLNPPPPLVELGQPTGPDTDNDLDDLSADHFQVTSLYLVNNGCSVGNPLCLSNPAATSYVPEPGSLSLALGALAVGWLVRRKKPGALVARTA